MWFAKEIEETTHEADGEEEVIKSREDEETTDEVRDKTTLQDKNEERREKRKENKNKKREKLKVDNEADNEGEDGIVNEMQKDRKYIRDNGDRISIVNESDYVNEERIDEVSDFTLATFLMERKVKL